MIHLKRLMLSLLITSLCVVNLTGCVSKSEIEALQSKVTSLEEENTSLRNQIQAIQVDSDEMQSAYSTIEADYKSLQTAYDGLETQYDILLADYENLTIEYETQSEEPIEIEKTAVSTEQVTRHYEWTYGGLEWTWDLEVSLQYYEYYQELPRAPTSNYSVYVAHPEDDTYIDGLVNRIKEAANSQGYDEFQTVEFVIAFIQSLPYTADSATTPFDEYPRYPLETLVDRGGDCEDTSILLASLLYSMDYDTVLIMPPDHCAVGILGGGEGIYGTFWEHEGEKYYYIETTGSGWDIGELPPEYKDAEAYVYGMVPIPILTHNWKSERTRTSMTLDVTIENLGSATAHDVYVFAGFDDGNDRLWNSGESQLVQLQSGQSITVTLFLKPPVDEHTRLFVQIIDDDYSVSESYSDWFDT